jgi:hypothetical protein
MKKYFKLFVLCFTIISLIILLIKKKNKKYLQDEEILGI